MSTEKKEVREMMELIERLKEKTDLLAEYYGWEVQGLKEKIFELSLTFRTMKDEKAEFDPWWSEVRRLSGFPFLGLTDPLVHLLNPVRSFKEGKRPEDFTQSLTDAIG